MNTISICRWRGIFINLSYIWSSIEIGDYFLLILEILGVIKILTGNIIIGRGCIS